MSESTRSSRSAYDSVRTATGGVLRRAALAASPRLRALRDDRDRAVRKSRALAEEVTRLRSKIDVQQIEVTQHADEAGRLRAQVAVQGGPRIYRAAEYEYVFIATYGRTGSTLLQGILNSIPGYQIRGENGNVNVNLFRFWRDAEKGRNAHANDTSPTQAWYGIDQFDSEGARAQVRELFVSSILKPDPGVRVTGFKEIRWWGKDVEDYVAWMHETFNGAKFVINNRDHEAVASSKWFAKSDRATVLKQLEVYEEALDKIEARLGDAAYRVHYDDYVADPDALQGLFRWLGEPWDRERVDEVLATRHSY